MVCKKCGRKLDPEDMFCRSCGTSVKSGVQGGKEKGYRDDLDSVLGGFDGKYMMFAGILLVVLMIAAGIVKFNYNQNQAKPTKETQSVSWLYEAENERG